LRTRSSKREQRTQNKERPARTKKRMTTEDSEHSPKT
jgi:hypothetical protein